MAEHLVHFRGVESEVRRTSIWALEGHPARRLAFV